MKNILFILFILSVKFLFADDVSNENPEAKFRLLRLDYNNSSGEKGVTFYDYTEKGICETALWELVNGQRYSINFQFYDKNNNMIKKVREYSDQRNTVQLYNYDENNHLISEEFFLRDTSRGITTFEYDNQNRIALIRCKAYNGWLNGIIKLKYDDKGQKIAGEFIQDSKQAAVIKYEYDEYGNMVKETWDFGKEWQQEFNYIYEKESDLNLLTFTSPNPYVVNLENPILKEEYKYSDKISGPSFYKYDSNGKLIEKIYKRSDGFKTNTFYIYGNNGILLRAFRRYSNGKNALFKFTYNDIGRITKKEFFINDHVYGSELYTYDSDNELEKAEFNNSDLWLNGIINFEKIKKGTTLKATYKDKQGFGAEINITYDSQLLLQNIIWQFSDGGVQSYYYFY
jgi:YD repeat-containing protein